MVTWAFSTFPSLSCNLLSKHSVKSRGSEMIHRFKTVSAILFFALTCVCSPAQTSSNAPTSKPVYEVFAIRYATIPDFPVNALVQGADPSRKLSIAMTVWLVRGNGRNILVDSGFY